MKEVYCTKLYPATWNLVIALNIMHLPMYPVIRASFCLLDWGAEKEALPEPHQTFEVAAAETPGLVNLILSCQTGIFECKHPFIDKPMVITEPTVASAWLLGLGLKLCPCSTCHICSTNILTQFMQSLSWVQ